MLELCHRCCQSGANWVRSGLGQRHLVLERHAEAGRGGSGCALREKGPCPAVLCSWNFLALSSELRGVSGPEAARAFGDKFLVEAKYGHKCPLHPELFIKWALDPEERPPPQPTTARGAWLGINIQARRLGSPGRTRGQKGGRGLTAEASRGEECGFWGCDAEPSQGSLFLGGKYNTRRV